jgi:hypothetical protein
VSAPPKCSWAAAFVGVSLLRTRGEGCVGLEPAVVQACDRTQRCDLAGLLPSLADGVELLQHPGCP